MTIAISEYHLSKTDFNVPRVSRDSEAIAVLIVRLILLEKGTIQSHPDMGVGLISNYRDRLDTDEDGGVVSSFLSELNNQIHIFLPIAEGVQINAEFKDKQLRVYIRINNDLYRTTFDDFGTNIESISLDEFKGL